MPGDENGTPTLKIIFIVSAALAALLAVFVLQRHHSVSRSAEVAAARPVPNDEQKAYLGSFGFADLHMSSAANFLGDTVTYLDASVTNKGSRTVRRLDVELNFVDMFNQVVLRETAHPLAGRAQPLRPGETCAFRVTFEHMPAEWNQAPPKAKAVYVELQ